MWTDGRQTVSRASVEDQHTVVALTWREAKLREWSGVQGRRLTAVHRDARRVGISNSGVSKIFHKGFVHLVNSVPSCFPTAVGALCLVIFLWTTVG
jgi:hypothetical protein